MPVKSKYGLQFWLNMATLFAVIISVVYMLVDFRIYKDKVDGLEKESEANIELWMKQHEINGETKNHMTHD